MMRDRRSDRQTDGRTDRQTNMAKLTVIFRNFASGPKKSFLSIFLPDTSKDEINPTMYPVRMQFLPQSEQASSL